MTREREIKILMQDRCTKAEAEKHLEKGTTIFEDFEQNFNSYMQELACDDDEIAAYKKMIEEKIPALDWGVVEFEGNTYYIMYSL